MKKRWVFLLTIIVILLIPTVSFADSFGPDEWHQYRMNSDKNAVFDNDSDPLKASEFETAEEVRATPVVVGDTLFIGNHESGDLFAFDIHTGEELWTNEAPNWIHSEMIYHNGKVYVGFGNRFFRDDGIRGTGENGILALDAESGDILWKYNTDGEVMPTPAYDDGAVYAVTGGRNLFKLDPDTGEVLHQAYIGSVVSMSAPAIKEDMLYVGGGAPEPYTFSAYDLEVDDFKWQKEFPDVYAGLDDVPPAVQDGIVVTTALEKTDDEDDPEHVMYGLDTESGEVLWKESLGVGEMVKNNKSGAPMIYEDKIYVGSPITKTFYAYDLETGERIWEFENEVMKAPPVAKDGVVYFSNADGSVYALEADTGELISEKKVSDEALAPAGPIIVNETMFIGSQDMNVYALPLTDFKQEEQDEDADLERAEEPDIEEKSETTSMFDEKYIVIGVLVFALLFVLLLALKKRKKR